jgi:hypothetical protein
VLERRVLVQHKTKRLTREIEGRVCIMRLPESEARKARKRARQEHGAKVSEQVLELAGYVVLFTTVPADRLSVSQCVELYRLRWQIELQFKRWKSLCGFDRMPNFRADTIASWLYAKILAAVLLERLTSLHSEVSPPIDCEDDDELNADGEAALEVDPVAVAAARLRAVADEALRAASSRRAYH